MLLIVTAKPFVFIQQIQYKFNKNIPAKTVPSDVTTSEIQKVVACGGTNDVILPQECYAFDPKSNQWTFYANMTHSRLGGASVVTGADPVQDGVMWLIGGVGYKFW